MWHRGKQMGCIACKTCHQYEHWVKRYTTCFYFWETCHIFQMAVNTCSLTMIFQGSNNGKHYTSVNAGKKLQ